MTPVLGVDGWSGAWVAVRVDLPEGRSESATRTGRVRVRDWRAGRFADLLSPDDRVVGVDMPIGLPEQGQRRCDLAARAALRPAGSRVFPVPARAAWAADDLGAANDWLRAAGEPGMSAQAFALRAAIAEVAAHEADARIVEVHPELAFLELTGGVLPAKKSAVGVARRIAALSSWVDVLAALGTAPPRVPVDDALDALAAAWTAARVVSGTTRRYPADGGDPDRSGRRMCIHA